VLAFRLTIDTLLNPQENSSQRVKWTIHRPVSGWYIRIRSPLFPPRSFVPLMPCDPSEGDPTMFLAFTCQTRIDMTPPPPAYPHNTQEGPLTQTSSMSYPPVPPTPLYSPTSGLCLEASTSISHVNASKDTVTSPKSSISAPRSPPPSFGASEASYNEPPSTLSLLAHAGVTRFIVKPANITTTAPSRLSFLPAALKSSIFGAGKSFTIQASQEFHPPTSSSSAPHPQLAPTTPVLTFHDITPLIGTRSTSGTIELDHGVARALGVDPSWWITVALAYIEFLDERDGYRAAADD